MFNYQGVRDQVWSPINIAFVWECVHECELKVFLWLWILMNSEWVVKTFHGMLQAVRTPEMQNLG